MRRDLTARAGRIPLPLAGRGLGVGYAFLAMANERARELRRDGTTAKRRLWYTLRQLKPLGFKFRQQVPIDHYIADFACLSQRLIIEVDGGTHGTDEELARDASREQYLRDQGFRVVRFWNSEVRENIEGVMDRIVDILGPPPPSPPRKGEGRRLPRGEQPSHDQDLERAHRAASAVLDPEIPVLTLEDLGVLRGVERREGRIVVKLTPTYTGCPATLAIRLAVETALAEAGLAEATVETVLSPPWSTDDITEAGRQKLQDFGIAPPAGKASERALFGEETVACPKCGSVRSAKISEFGSTPCKSLWRCESCAEPFDAFKCL
jgi:ring-1,2-phenylacetyl-CoA epoxidase subunit PaaD